MSLYRATRLGKQWRDTIWYQMPERTSILIRCSPEEADIVHSEAAMQHRTVSGYLLYALERSLWIEEKFFGFTRRKRPVPTPRPVSSTAVHLRCTTEEADRIRQAARRRLMSISGFILFSLHRHWDAANRVRQR